MAKPERSARANRWTMLATLLVAATGLQGCLGSDDDESPVASDSSSDPPGRASGPAAGPSRDLVHRCDWSSGKEARESAVRNAFVDRESGDVRLLLAKATVRPGELLAVAVANDSRTLVQYGTFSHIETETGETVRIRGPYGYPAIGLSAEPRGVGPCVTLAVPSSTQPGDYVAVLDDVRVAGEETADLRASFRIDGKPISNPEWEVRLRKAARENRSRRQARADR